MANIAMQLTSNIQQLEDFQHIDFYLAQSICHVYVNHTDLQLTNNEQTQLFYMVMLLNGLIRAGHVCCPLDYMANYTWYLKSDDKTEPKQAKSLGYQFPTKSELTSLWQKLAKVEGQQALLVIDNNCVYLRRFYQFERALQQAICQHLGYHFNHQINDIKLVLAKLFTTPNNDIDYQKIAVANALNKGFSVIAGGPGTGKTYTVAKLLAALVLLNKQSSPLKIAMAAPTGKAAQRLSESIQLELSGLAKLLSATQMAQIPKEALTIHRLLGVIPNRSEFKHNQQNPINADVLLVDEVSMVDLALFTRLMQALKPSCQVILLGDAEQLPSVACGNVLNDLAPKIHPGYSSDNLYYLNQVCGYSLPKAVNNNSAADHLTILQHSRRFTADSGIGHLAKAVIASQTEQSLQLFSQNYNDIAWYQSETWFETSVAQYYQAVFSASSPEQALDKLSEFRILCVTREGPQSVSYFNEKVFQWLTKQQLIKHQQGELYHGLPIMIEQNHYRMGLFNGDIGIIWQMENGTLMAVFPQQEKYLLPSQLPQYSPVYAMTIHKTQGSEFAHVMIVLPENGGDKLLSRELLYTGITRAKKSCAIQANKASFSQCIKQKVVRFSNLNLNGRDKIDV